MATNPKRRRVGSPTNETTPTALPAAAAAALKRRRQQRPPSPPASDRARRAPTRRSAKKPRAAPFPAKLFDMVSNHPDILRWNDASRELVIADPHRLTTELMPRFFTVTTGTGLVKSFARQLNYYGFHRVGSPRGPGGRARQSLDGGALVFANRNPRVATVNDLASLVRHEKPPARAAPIATPRVSEASSSEESARVVTPPACPGGPAPTPSDRPWTLDVGSLLREAAQAAASGAS